MDIPIHFKGGGSFVSHRPQFSTDLESIYTARKNCILCYSAKTGNLLSKYKGMTNHIMGFKVHDYGGNQCITACSETGEVITWEAVSRLKMINKQIDQNNIKTFHVTSSHLKGIKTLISYQQDNYVHFGCLDLNTERSNAYKLRLPNNHYYIDCCEEYFSVVHDKILYVVEMNNFNSHKRHRIQGSRFFTCVSCHSEREIVLTGDNTGRVVAWQNIFSRKAIQTVYHWHILPVKCVTFSNSGSYFYSGGEECVLVRWQFDNALERKFLPRLAAAVQQINVSTCNSIIAIATGDNAISIIDANFNQISLIQQLVIGNNFKTGILLDPRTKALVMNGNVGHLQWYYPNDKSLLYNIDIVNQNKIANERNANIYSTEITKVAISQTGLWMGTVEEREDSDYSPEIRMKFWKFDLEKQIFELNTSIEYPHEDSVKAILFQPTNNDNEIKCITVGNDKTFKIWQLCENLNIHNKSSIWKCVNVGFYHNMPCEGLSISADGSLIAVGFGPCVTTWLLDSCEFKCSLVHPVYKQKINQVQFGNNNLCHLLVAVSNNYLSVWNLLSLNMLWTTNVHVSYLITNSLSTYIAVISRDKKLFVFIPDRPEPIYTSDKLLANHERICAAAFIPHQLNYTVQKEWYKRNAIYFINANRELYCIGDDENDINTNSLSVKDNGDSVFRSLEPKIKTSHVQNNEPIHHKYPRDRTYIEKFFESPVYAMNPIRITCRSLLSAMVLQKEHVK